MGNASGDVDQALLLHLVPLLDAGRQEGLLVISQGIADLGNLKLNILEN